MSIAIDYRSQSVTSINDTISRFKATSKLHDDVLNGLLAVAVWHSIKDGQVTPATRLLDACSRSLQDKVSLYLTKYGNIKYSKKEGLVSDKHKNSQRYGKEKADEVFNTLPTLAEAFPTAPRQWTDIKAVDIFKNVLKKEQDTKEHGHRVVGTEDELAILELIRAYMQGETVKVAFTEEDAKETAELLQQVAV